MTTPEVRPAAPIVWHGQRNRFSESDLEKLGPDYGATKLRGRPGAQREYVARIQRDVPGQLWQREAARDVQAHGEPVKAGRGFPRWGGTGKRRPAPAWLEYRAFIAEGIERRRPAMRATRAELDALNGRRRLEPEPSSMARTGLALGLAFTSDDAKA